MVQRVEGGSAKLDEFEGIVESVTKEEGMNDNKQYHIVINPTNVTVAGKTGRIHEWVPMSKRATEEAVPQGCVMDRYLQQVEVCIREAKTCKTVGEELGMLNGKKFRFKKIKLGKDFDGHPAREYAVPVMPL